MEKKEKKNKFLKFISHPAIRKLLILFFLGMVLLFLFIIRNNREFCEGYSRTFVQFYTIVFGHISSFFPFSLFELFVVGTFIYALTWIVFFFKNTKKNGIKKSYHMILRLGIIIISIATLYQGTAGIEYTRKDVEIPLHNELIENPKDYRQICFKFLDDFNYCASTLEFDESGEVIAPYSDDELVRKLEYEYSKLDSDYFHSYTSRAKPMYLTGWLYRALSISGVTFVPTAEANYNILNPKGYLPFVIAHEIAHVKGAMPEENANLTAAYICLNSDDPYIRYSGHNIAFWSLGSLVQATNVKDDMTEFYKKIDRRIYKNNAYENEYWESHAIMRKISNWINNLYLQMNADNGTISYTDNIDVIHTDTEYIVHSYSRYQALYMWMYFDKPNAK